MLQATTEAKAVMAADLAVAVAGRQAVEPDQPAWIPLEVATLGAPEAQVGTLGAKPARVPVAQATTVWAKR
jgi:hypothetical protein